jgi:hypothetical protein
MKSSSELAQESPLACRRFEEGPQRRISRENKATAQPDPPRDFRCRHDQRYRVLTTTTDQPP